jgi:hypothetical protein
VSLALDSPDVTLPPAGAQGALIWDYANGETALAGVTSVIGRFDLEGNCYIITFTPR